MRRNTCLALFMLLAAGLGRVEMPGWAAESTTEKPPAGPKTAVLVGSFSVTPFGGDTLRLADLNGDGKLELLILQSPGQFGSKLYRGQKDLDAVDRNLYCLTAVTLEGRVLWQDGKPYDRNFPFTSHGTQGGCMMPCVDDVDGDGKPEVIVIRHGELVLLEAATGKTKAHVRLPADNFVDVSTAQFGPREKGRQIICKVNDRSYKPWPYANPIVVYNADLSLYHEPFPDSAPEPAACILNPPVRKSQE